MSNLSKKIGFKLTKVTSAVNELLPKKQKRIVLYSNWGFRDNLKSLYNYLVEHDVHKEYEIICSSNDFYGMEKTEGVRYTGVYKGLYYFLFSKYFFYCFGKYPIKPSKKQMVVNLWHGTPLKNIGNLEKGKQNIDYNFFTKLLVSSDYFKPILQKAFNAREEQLLVLGNIRNDELFEESPQKRIIWMPTYRNSGEYQDSDSSLLFGLKEQDYLEINKVLAEKGWTLYIKAHPLEESLLAIPEKCEHIQILTEQSLADKGQSLYQFLGTTSALITDYSSVFLDYYLLDRPVGFAINDYEEYKVKRGFVFEDIKHLFAGEEIFVKRDVLSFIEKVSSGEDSYKEKRKEVNNLANKVKRDLTKTLLDEIGIHLGK